MSYGAGVRNQVFEVIVRQAIAGAPWREICAGPMQVNDIKPEDVEAEVFRRLHKGKEALSTEGYQSLTTYIAAWKSVVNDRKMGPEHQIEEIITSFYIRQRLDKPTIVFCKSPAMMYFHLMLLTGRKCFGQDDSNSDSNIRATEMLSRNQSETFRSNLFESIKDLSFDTEKYKSGPAIGLSWKDGYRNLASAIGNDMNRNLESDLSTYFTWGFRPEVEPFVRSLGLIYDIAISHAQSIATEFELPSVPADVRRPPEMLVLAQMFGEPPPPMPAVELPNEVVRFHSVGLWNLPEILAAGFVLENLKAGELFSETVREELPCWLSLFRAAPMYAFFENICLVAAYPETVVFDELLRPGTRDGAAITFPDDYHVYAIDGIAVPRKFHQHPEELTVDEIDEVVNVALRRLMIESYGSARYLMDSGAVLIHEDECGKLYRKELPNDEPILMICVTNSTMEPDGTYRQYYLRVPPYIETASAGVAWTFDMEDGEYSPTQQT